MENYHDEQRPLLEENTNAIDTSEENTILYDVNINHIEESYGYSFQLSEDLLIEILCKLPFKFLVRFKTVSKSWKLLIDSPVLAKKKTPLTYCFPLIWYNSFHPPFAEYSEFYPQQLFDVHDSCRLITVVGSSNGLVCLRTTDPRKEYFIFNPTTQDLSFLPPSAIQSANDPDELYSAGFYFVPKTQEYRLVTFATQGYEDEEVVIWVLTLGKTHFWREVRGILPGLIMDDRYAISETTIYWLGLDNEEEENENVICFDFVEERFRQISVPPSTTDFHWGRILVVIKDCVSMLVYPLGKNQSFDIWVLDNCETWVKQRKVGPLQIGKRIKPIDIWSDHEKLMVICSKIDENNMRALDLFYYNLETNEVGDFPTTFQPQELRIVSFVESLVSIDGLVPYIDNHVYESDSEDEDEDDYDDDIEDGDDYEDEDEDEDENEDEDEDEDDSEDEDEDDDHSATNKSPAAKTDDTSDKSDSDNSSEDDASVTITLSSDNDDFPAGKVSAVSLKSTSAVSNKDQTSKSESYKNNDCSKDDVPAAAVRKAPGVDAKKEMVSSDNFEDVSSEDEPKQKRKKISQTDVEIVDAEPTPNKDPKTPVTPNVNS